MESSADAEKWVEKQEKDYGTGYFGCFFRR